MSPTVELPVVTSSLAPMGFLRCPACERRIELGQPYKESPSHLLDGGGELLALTCVYCTAPEPCEGVIEWAEGTRPEESP